MICCLRFCIGSVNYGTFRSYSSARDARILKKLVESGKKRQSKLKVSSRTPMHLLAPEAATPDKKKNAINKIYMNHVSELLPAMETGNKLISLGFTVLRVNLNKSTGTMEVYWFANCDDKTNEIIESLLSSASFQLRSELGLIKKIGRPPLVKFVKDMVHGKTIEVERIYDSAEFKRDLKLAGALQDSDLNVDAEVDKMKIPEMRQDLFGLDHAKMFGRISLELKKKCYEPKESDAPVAEVNVQPLIKFDRVSYDKFYRKKKALRQKLLKHNESLIYNPADDFVHERETQIDWEYEDDEEDVDLEIENERFLAQKQKMGQKEEIKEEN